jgi:uncharacterized protein (DUF849 family)
MTVEANGNRSPNEEANMTMTHDFRNQVESRVYRRTGGRVRQLCVQFDRDRVVVYGEAPTYYSMQLATAALTDLFPDREVINAIEVI